jgi:hypothetical protein
MTPTERIIQSRMKEAFAFKVTPEEWSTFVEAVDASKGFRVEEIIEDSTIGSKARAIYQKDEQSWTGVDQSPIQESDLVFFEELRYFLDEFFNEGTYQLSANSEFRIKLD